MTGRPRIEYQDLTLRPANEADAEFLLRLREPAADKGLIHHSVSSLADQRQWLANYRLRESRGEEFYFVVLCNGKPCGTTRLTEIKTNSFTSGSWVFVPEAPKFAALKSLIINRLFGFTVLDKKTCFFDVRKHNTSVLRFHQMFGGVKIRETDQDVFFRISRSEYLSQVRTVARLCRFDLPGELKAYVAYD
jgi:hypothetical protein